MGIIGKYYTGSWISLTSLEGNFHNFDISTFVKIAIKNLELISCDSNDVLVDNKDAFGNGIGESDIREKLKT